MEESATMGKGKRERKVVAPMVNAYGQLVSGNLVEREMYGDNSDSDSGNDSDFGAKRNGKRRR